MVISTFNLLLIVITLGLAYLTIGRAISPLLGNPVSALGLGTRQLGWFLARSPTPEGSVIGGCYLLLATFGPPTRSTRRSREAARSSFSPSFGQSPFCLPSLNDGPRARRFWALMAKKP